eukprot:CAMPEP_0119108864 /NCGR_PEP_ID=MMETSP1180-20130426/15869_1 /TAXON_ID=3052 ORGANISM="Chlamydomonas cf sp, Strain CCMP681" /NCGR_SAMPLE_ID=MMETSP1180 /ASSEMBLY_ACC=CAM_ASM_000741 /LENGTH=230 /DNA_ID=CAMNT_0007094535 /DNA_START=57 /DNA_END=749 /DNA_ORIENTATION=+
MMGKGMRFPAGQAAGRSSCWQAFTGHITTGCVPSWTPTRRHLPRKVACSAISNAANESEADEDLSLAELRQKLDVALKQEDYSAAARFRDALQHKSVDAKLAVEDANRAFYAAFRSGNVKEMESIVGQGEHVQVVHPGSNCIAGREAVIESWRSLLVNVRPRAFKLALEDVRVWANDTCGTVTCVEVINADDSTGRIAATNVFEKQGGRWVLIVHHGSPAPPLKRPRVIQ